MRFLQIAAFSAFVFILMSNSCEREVTENPEISDTEITTESEVVLPEKVSFRFSGTDDDKWKIVDSLEQEGLYRSALEVVQDIYTSELEKGNVPQVIKATMYKMKYNSYLEEDDFVKALYELDLLTRDQKFPLKQIAHSITADAYWQYYQSNRWLFLNRSETVNFEQKDVRTWDLNKILDHCRMNYMLSIESPDSLFATDILDFKDMLVLQEGSEIQQPTLLDFLGNRALNHLQNDEAGLTQAIDHFRIQGKEYFSDEQSFASTNLSSSREETNLTAAIKTFQILTKAHLRDASSEARVDLLIKRLHFIRRQSIDADKDNLYIAALNQAIQKYENYSSVAELSFQLASYYNEQGQKYTPGDETNRWEKKHALEICTATISKYPDSFGSEQCKGLMYNIEQKSLALKTEEAYQPNTKGKFLIEYKNLDSLYFRMVEVPWDYYFVTDKYGRELLNDIMKNKVVKEWSARLTNPGDYQMHSTELPVTIPKNGHYVLLASPKKDFSINKNAVTYTELWSTNLAYTYRNTDKQDIELIVNDRFTGTALEGVRVNIYIRKYDYILRKYQIKHQETYTTDKNGMITIRSKTDYRNIYVDLQQENDRYNNAYRLYQYRPYEYDKTRHSTTYFTDRSIYRPGQTVYFKGISIKSNGNQHTIETSKKVTVSLYDVNGQLVSKQDFVSNDFGTFSGSFKLPEGLLNGQMRIQDQYGNRWFSVEEYKRPRFEVEMLPTEGEYRLNEHVTVTGKATAYAGSTIDGAKVTYRITRGCNFPYWRWYKGVYPYVAQTEIDFGTVETDETGKFEITFNATDDPTVKKSLLPTYYYAVHVDVTDINGETRSSESWVQVGYKCLNLSLEIPDVLDKNGFSKFRLNTLNLNGVKLNTTGIITVQKVIENERIFRDKLWNNPDIVQFSEEEYRNDFPHEAYGEEDDVTRLPLSNDLIRLNFNTENSDSILISGIKTLEPGKYKIVSSAIDPFGEKVEDIHYITVFDRKSETSPTNDLWMITPLKIQGEPGEFAEVLIASGADMEVMYEVEQQNNIIKRERLHLKHSQQLIKLPILEAYRGNVTLHFHAVKFGRSFSEKYDVNVPYTNKQLDVEIETFRDKLQPGEKEKWRVTIKGARGEKVSAELLATMYDASLDAFASNYFYLNVFNNYYSSRYWNSNSFSASTSNMVQDDWNMYLGIPYHQYSYLNSFGYNGYYSGYYNYYDRVYDLVDGNMEIEESERFNYAVADEAPATPVGGSRAPGKAESDFAAGTATTKLKSLEQSADNDYRGDKKQDGKDIGISGEFSNIQVRSNFNETAFFYPDLKTNEKGEVVIEFTAPESLTKWKILGLAHTKDLKTGMLQKELVTQKELMILSNAPRFIREGDILQFSAKLSNLSEKDLNGSAVLQLIDPANEKVIDQLFSNTDSKRTFSIKKDESTEISWRLEVPFGINAVKYKILAKADNFSDGEEMIVPVLSNRMLVTESLPLPVRGTETKNFRFEKLINSGSSSSLKHHQLTLEYTANPAWYAVQAMPYMMEYPYECAEQVFTRYYSNAIASEIMNSNPKIKEVFNQWQNESPESLLSNLQKNQELKSLFLEETPWVFEANNESERKKRISLLFNMNKMDNELHKALKKLQQMQVANGGWPWFKGMEESRYITQHVVTGMGHLDVMGVKDVHENNNTWKMVTDAIHYLDKRIKEDYDWIKSHYPDYKSEQYINNTQVQYLYARSYFPDVEIPSSSKEAINYFKEQAKTYWKSFNLYNEGMIALFAHRDNDKEFALKIMASLKERAIEHDELGMYWKDNTAGYYWYQAPIETQALLIEAFDEVTDDQTTVEALKIWLLKQKQTTDWKTTKATAEACYALLRRGTDLLTESSHYEIKIGSITIDENSPLVKAEAGTGYFKTSWGTDDIKPEMGQISISRSGEGVSWGAVYWQYFEDLDKITPHETPLSLKKDLFKVIQTASGPVIEPITTSSPLQPGDKIRVRVELRSDRDMEYLHLKDMRASGFEPVNVFSGYRWQDGLSYYESTKDASTNFFIEYLRKGTYVFEYDLIASHAGDFSNGISSIQCMYAPEFTSHSEGVRVKIESQKK